MVPTSRYLLHSIPRVTSADAEAEASPSGDPPVAYEPNHPLRPVIHDADVTASRGQPDGVPQLEATDGSSADGHTRSIDRSSPLIRAWTRSSADVREHYEAVS